MLENLLPFCIAAVLLTVSPGADQIYIVSRTLAQGKLVGLVSSWGVCTGAAIHILAAAFGFSVIIQSSAFAYSLLKYLGAGYLVWLGIQAFRHRAVHVGAPGIQKEKPSLMSVYMQGIMVDVCNPKVALFFLAFLPQFIPEDEPDRIAAFLMLGSIVLIIGLLWEALLVFFTNRILGRLLQSSRAVSFLNYAMGTVFLGLALHIIFFDETQTPEPVEAV